MEYEARVLKKDNTTTWIRAKGRVFFDEEGKPLFITSNYYPHNSSVINKLKKHVGPEGFRVVYKEDMDALYPEDEEENEDEGKTSRLISGQEAASIMENMPAFL